MRRLDLLSDCASCAALCCVATSFEASDDFAFDKPAGARCANLRPDCRCAIHPRLVERGFSGCTVFDCYGAGPRATRAFAGATDADAARNAAFLSLRAIHEMLWTLTEAAKLCAPSLAALGAEISAEVEALDALAAGPTPRILEADVDAHHEVAAALLRRVGEGLGGRRRTAEALGLSREAARGE